MDKDKALDAAMTQIERQYGKGSIMRMGDHAIADVQCVPTGSLALDIALGGVGVPKGRVVGLLGHNGAGKTTLMKALVGLADAQGSLSVMGLHPVKDRVQLLRAACYIPDVAILPRWARVQDLVSMMAGIHPRFSAARVLFVELAMGWILRFQYGWRGV